MWTIFKVFIEFVTILLLFYILVFWPGGIWDLSSPTRDRTHTPCIGKRSLNHWIARDVLQSLNLIKHPGAQRDLHCFLFYNGKSFGTQFAVHQNSVFSLNIEEYRTDI